MRAIALGFDLQENFFYNKIDAQDHNMRLLHYPAIKTDLLRKDGQARAGAHTDYGEPVCVRCLSVERSEAVVHRYFDFTFPGLCKCQVRQNGPTVTHAPLQVGGLQVQNPITKQFAPAPPIVSAFLPSSFLRESAR